MFVIENAKGRSASPMESSLGFGDDGFILLCICGLLWVITGVFISVPIKTMTM